MKNSILLYLFLSYNFLFSYHNLMAQGSCVDDNTVIVDNLEHQTAFETLIYKTTIITNVLGIPTTVNIPLQVYYPTDLAPDEKRPLVVYIHGGFFIGGSLTDFSALAQETAQAGFIAATVDYRLCVTSDCLFAGATSYPCSVEWGNLLFRAYTAMIDVSDAIRFLQNKEDDYHIDSQNIIVGGHSAGALTALNLAYTDADEIASVCPTCPLAEPYVPANGIRACMPLSGAIYYTDWIDPDESNVSTILVHGTHDGVVPYDHDYIAECCSGEPFPRMYGACPIVERLESIGANYELITGENCSHDVFIGGFLEAAKPELLAFIIKTTLCNENNVQRHLIYTPPTPQALCPPEAIFSAIPATTCNLPTNDPYNLQVGIDTPITPTAMGWQVRPTLVDQFLLISPLLNSSNMPYTIQISNTIGQIVYQQYLSNVTELNIATSNWTKGCYWVTIINHQTGTRAVQKIIKAS